MLVSILAGTGRGQTALSALDAALDDCGVLDYHLIRLGSALPPEATIREFGRLPEPPHDGGDRLDVVIAEQRATAPGVVIGAGLGWIQRSGERGVIVAHDAVGDHGESAVEIEATVLDQIYASLRDLCARRGIPFDGLSVGWRLASTTVEREPAAVVVLAVRGEETWH